MAQHFVKVVDDNTLATSDGWMIARCEDTGGLYLVIERSAASDEAVLHDAWTAVRPLVIQQAVEDGIVEWARERVGV